MNYLKNQIRGARRRYGRDIGMIKDEMMLTRWYFSQIDEEELKDVVDDELDDDPFDPFFPHVSDEPDRDMVEYLVGLGMPKGVAENIHRGLRDRVRIYIQDINQLSKYLDLYDDRIVVNRNDDVTILTLKVDSPMLVSIPRTFRNDIGDIIGDSNNMTVRINTEYYDKLKSMIIPGSGLTDDELIFVLVKRYITLGGLNYQSAIPDSLFDLIHDVFNITHEAFASPINRYTKMTYTSLYPDIDQWFGSLGIYRDSDLVAGSKDYVGIEANPPFTNQAFANLSDYMKMVLDDPSRGVTFFVVLPTWRDSPGYIEISNSEYTRFSMELTKYEHQYIVGSHFIDSAESGYVSLANTTIFVLQNDKAAREYPVPDDFENMLADAFVGR